MIRKHHLQPLCFAAVPAVPVGEVVPLMVVDIDIDVDAEPVPVVLAPVAEPVAEAHGGRVDGSVTPPLYHIHQQSLCIQLLRLQ